MSVIVKVGPPPVRAAALLEAGDPTEGLRKLAVEAESDQASVQQARNVFTRLRAAEEASERQVAVLMTRKQELEHEIEEQRTAHAAEISRLREEQRDVQANLTGNADRYAASSARLIAEIQNLLDVKQEHVDQLMASADWPGHVDDFLEGKTTLEALREIANSEVYGHPLPVA